MEHSPEVAHIVFMLSGLLLTAAIIFTFTRITRLPFTIVLVLVGIVLHLLIDYGPDFFDRFIYFELSPGIILFIFLPALIFESSFNLNSRMLFQNITPILTLAIPGLVLSTAIIGLSIGGVKKYHLLLRNIWKTSGSLWFSSPMD